MEDKIIEYENYLKKNYTSEKTISSYLSDVKKFIKHYSEYYGEDIISFSRGHVIEYKKYLLEELGEAFTTINRKLASLSIYENFLIEIGIKKSKDIIKRDYFKIDLPTITADMLPQKTIKKVVLKSSVNNIRDYMILTLMQEGGLRVSEVIGIVLNRDVDFEMRRIVIFGKGNKIRYILMSDAIYEALNEYLPEREKILNGKENKYLIISNRTANNGKQIHRSLVNKLLSKYCEELKEENIHPHQFRHQYATNKYQEGYNEMMLKKSLGQSSNVVNRYVHEGYEDEIAKKVRERKNNTKYSNE